MSDTFKVKHKVQGVAPLFLSQAASGLSMHGAGCGSACRAPWLRNASTSAFSVLQPLQERYYNAVHCRRGGGGGGTWHWSEAGARPGPCRCLAAAAGAAYAEARRGQLMNRCPSQCAGGATMRCAGAGQLSVAKSLLQIFVRHEVFMCLSPCAKRTSSSVVHNVLQHTPVGRSKHVC